MLLSLQRPISWCRTLDCIDADKVVPRYRYSGIAIARQPVGPYSNEIEPLGGEGLLVRLYIIEFICFQSYRQQLCSKLAQLSSNRSIMTSVDLIKAAAESPFLRRNSRTASAVMIAVT